MFEYNLCLKDYCTAILQNRNSHYLLFYWKPHFTKWEGNNKNPVRLKNF